MRFTSEDNVKEDAVPAAVRQMRPLRNPPGELEELFKAHHAKIFRAAYRVTGSTVDAEDVLQNVFLRLVKGGDEYDFGSNPEAYLYRSAINASLDLMRSRTRSKAVAIDDVEAEIFENKTLSPESEQEDRELKKLIQAAVAKLGARSAEMFVLRYYEGYDNREIAEMLNTSQMVVGVTLHRARVRLRKEIGQYLEKHHDTRR